MREAELGARRGRRAARQEPADREAAPADRAVRQRAVPGADRGRIRQRQGAGRELAAPHEPARRAPVPRAELRGDLAEPGRADAVRLRQGLVHRRHHLARGLLRGRQGFARCSWTRSASCRSSCRRSCCACWRTASIQRVGETQSRVSNARVVAATNRDMRQEIRAGRFRADLYHRLSVFTINVPPLRDLGEDKRLLLDHFREFYARQARVEPVRARRRARWTALARLRLSRQRARAAQHRDPADHEICRPEGRRGPAAGRSSTWRASTSSCRASPAGQDFKAVLEAARRHLQLQKNFNLDNTLAQWERGYVEAALMITQGNLTQAAKLLGIHRTTLYSRMQSYGEPERSGDNAATGRQEPVTYSAARLVRAAGETTMYYSHFGLNQAPFKITPEHRVLLQRRQPRPDPRGADLRHHPRRGHHQGDRRGRQRQDHAVPHAARRGCRRTSRRSTSPIPASRPRKSCTRSRSSCSSRSAAARRASK